MKTKKISHSKSTWKPKAICGLVAMVFLLGYASWASAAHVYDEALHGDLPHPNKAYVIPFGAPNPNTIKFTMDLISDGWIIDIKPGESLVSFTLTDCPHPAHKKVQPRR